jgi:NADP-dependent 3-hydroxy acid dehydrogenase YdfG
MALRDWLRGGRPKPDADAVARVKGWALAILAANPDTAVTVSEIVCLDPGCPGTETVILIMQPGRRTRAAKVAKAVEKVTAEDVAEALASNLPTGPGEVPRS